MYKETKKPKFAAEMVARIFGDQASDLKASNMIEAGVNPFWAWMYVRGMSTEKLVEKMNLWDRWAEQDMGGIEYDAMRAFRDLLETNARDLPEPDFIVSFSILMGITPADLVPDRYPFPEDGRSWPLPARPEIVEAAVLYAEEAVRMRLPMDQRLIQFLMGECNKAEKLGSQPAIFPADQAQGVTRHEDMLQVAESVFYADTQVDKDAEDFGLKGIELFHMDSDMALDTFEAKTKEMIARYADDAGRNYDIREAHRKALWRCANALAPMNGTRQWLQHIDATVKEHGTIKTMGMLAADPDKFGMRPNWAEVASTTLADGRFLGGRGVLNAFCVEYTHFQSSHQARAKALEERETRLNELSDFRTWRKSPQARDYLNAIANQRRILSHRNHAELAMMLEAEPKAAPVALPPMPVRKLLTHQKPENS